MSPADYQLFIDLDGVLVDFDTGVFRATGKAAGELQPRQMWPILSRTPNFYDRLEWMEDGQYLWDAVKNSNPAILTGLPMGNWAAPQKRSWCARELGDKVPVIAGLSRLKAELAQQWMDENNISDRKPVLVDDRLKLRETWEQNGGVFIFHISAKESLNALRQLNCIN